MHLILWLDLAYVQSAERAAKDKTRRNDLVTGTRRRSPRIATGHQPGKLMATSQEKRRPPLFPDSQYSQFTDDQSWRGIPAGACELQPLAVVACLPPVPIARSEQVQDRARHG